MAAQRRAHDVVANDTAAVEHAALRAYQPTTQDEELRLATGTLACRATVDMLSLPSAITVSDERRASDDNERASQSVGAH